MMICAAVAVLGAIVSYYFIEESGSDSQGKHSGRGRSGGNSSGNGSGGSGYTSPNDSSGADDALLLWFEKSSHEAAIARKRDEYQEI